MVSELDEAYLSWLYSQVASVKTRARNRTYWSLLRQLHSVEFVWLVPRDDNRAEHGRALRDEFLRDGAVVVSGDVSDDWLSAGCTMLEMLIALARVLAFEVDGEPRAWFWHLIEILDLEQFNDREYDHHACEVIEEATTRVIWRLYAPNGVGGLFPLRNPAEDQRVVELWYQASAYLLEQF